MRTAETDRSLATRVGICPACATTFAQPLAEGATVTCGECQGTYRVIFGDDRDAVIFVENNVTLPIEPLFLPAGSIRALVALMLAGVCWFLIAAGREVHTALLSLILTVIAYYFGYRSQTAATGGVGLDARYQGRRPLFLPDGAIRNLLALGFTITGAVLYLRGMLAGVYAEFYVILAGLILGHFAGRALGVIRSRTLLALCGHVKGLGVLAVVAVLAYAFLTGLDQEYPSVLVAGTCGLVSFYFGARR